MTQIIQFIFSFRFFYFLCALFASVSAVFSLTYQLQIFQQNSYFPKRYIPWLKENEKSKLVYGIIFYMLYTVLMINKGVTVVALWFFIYAVFCIVRSVKLQKKAIIPLKFTARIKRMYGVFIFLMAVSCALQLFLLKDVSFWSVSLNVLFSFFPYLSVFLLWALLFSTEKSITNRYIKDAKRILASYNGRLKVIGVTGSFGKTGTKMILTAMLKEKYNVLTTPKNFNTTMGVVRTVREYLKPQTEIFVCEMGAKKTGDIKEICDLVCPVTALITTVGPQHLDTFGSIDNVFATKFELYDSVNKVNGETFVCGDSEEIKSRVADREVILYGSDFSYGFYADNITCSASGVTFDLHLKDETVQINTKLLGRHNVQNIVGAAAVAYSYGVSPQSIKFAVSRLTAPEHRLEIKRYAKGSTLIDDAYNSNPVGCLEACRVLSHFAPMKRVLITPGLVELGDEEYKHNFRLGEEAAECADYIILVGKERSQPIKDGITSKGYDQNCLFVAGSFNEAYEHYLSFADKDTVVLIENDLPDNYLK
ncbi:MAG: UDP-N-acetylmuramoyl-tripeptide--D-alanyl-D-alanine ligase [Acutalibacteraceae bacterium]|nr:UDP-N-acetylmuramoyl-tripeptide--D-alanyl-D-alanine ligase [Acutalibacteraceae bacterium]